MKKQMLSLFLALALTGCAAPGPGSTSAPAESGAAPAGSEAPASASQEESGYDRREAIERPEIGAEVVIDPPYDFDPAEMVPGDFGDYFTDCDHPTQVSTYKLAEGTDIENEVTVLQGEEEGPTIYIVAGVHGDEIAGWMTGNLVKKIGIRAGTVHILSPANRWGAEADPRVRYVTEQEDLNRSFPGDPEGNMAQRVADSIYQDIQRVDPVFLFDLHEARANAENKDFLGSSLIYTDLSEMSDMYLEMLMATESGELCSERFNFYGPGPIGSINNTVTTQLGIPTITVETYRGYELERRIGDQLDIVEYVLRYYCLI